MWPEVMKRLLTPDVEGNFVHDSDIYTQTNNYWKYITTSLYSFMIQSALEVTLPVLVFLSHLLHSIIRLGSTVPDIILG
jgi:hypothetical protein